MRTARFLAAAGVLLCLLQAQVPKPKIGDSSAGSRSRPAHIIALRDPEGDTIQPGDRHALPFSVTQTCGGECHDVQKISEGWHFNAIQDYGDPGRKGQPWILVDHETATQMPLSYRKWSGTYQPSDIGMSPYEFALRFGGRTPGFAPLRVYHIYGREWRISGNLEVNCLVCHDASPAYDHAEYANQVAKENFRYAPAAASGLGLVTGSSKQMPDTFDYLLPNSVEDSLQAQVPKVEYAPSNFLPSGKVAFDIVRQPKASQCYYCHTNTDVEFTGAARFQGHEDIHITRGINCSDCHRNGLDHMMMRGYEKGSLTCEGCHAEGNPMGAPHPTHAGIPPLHFAKMTCTACHSGPLPEQTTRQFKNGMTHGLGEFNVNKASDAPPHLYYPVFARNEEGKLEPNRLMWPSFWGRMQNGKVVPLHPDQVKKAIAKAKLPAAIDDQSVASVLRALDADGPAVYIAGGKLHRLVDGKLRAEDHAQAEPYLWPIAHDVRPATQALGAKGCQDCHSTQAALFFGKVAVDSPLASDRTATWTMARFEKNLDPEYQARLARTWQYRGWLKIIGIGASALLLLVLLAYTLRAVDHLSAAAVGRLRVVVNVAGFVTLLLVIYTAYFHPEDDLTGQHLIWHVSVAPAFALAAVAVALFWAHASRLSTGGKWTVRLRDLFFWIALALAIPTFASILAAMFPLAGTEGQRDLIALHRVCGQLLAGSSLLFAGFAFFTWWQRRHENAI